MALFSTLLCLLLALGLMIPLCNPQATTPPAITAPEPTLGPIPSYTSPPPASSQTTPPTPYVATAPTFSSQTPPPPAASSIIGTPPTSFSSPPPPFGTSIPLAPGTATTLPNGAAFTASLEKLSISGIVLVGGAALFV